nr:MAG TPA: hypothetical protein [Caudoviricetes sp.]
MLVHMILRKLNYPLCLKMFLLNTKVKNLLKFIVQDTYNNHN